MASRGKPVPGAHAAWHVLACLGLLTTTPFLKALEASSLSLPTAT